MVEKQGWFNTAEQVQGDDARHQTICAGGTLRCITGIAFVNTSGLPTSHYNIPEFSSKLRTFSTKQSTINWHTFSTAWVVAWSSFFNICMGRRSSHNQIITSNLIGINHNLDLMSCPKSRTLHATTNVYLL